MLSICGTHQKVALLDCTNGIQIRAADSCYELLLDLLSGLDSESLTALQNEISDRLRNEQARDFHRQRDMFAILRDEDMDRLKTNVRLKFASSSDPRSHSEWLKEDFGIRDPILRGYVDKTGIYYYSGDDFSATKDDFKKILVYLKDIGAMCDCSEDTPVYAGVIRGEIGKRWNPVQKIGSLREALAIRW